MKVYLGIDLGSTTSKAIILNEQEEIIGRGITNTRANYEVAAEIARMEAEFNSRFTLLFDALKSRHGEDIPWDELYQVVATRFHYLQFQERFRRLIAEMNHLIQSEYPDHKDQYLKLLEQTSRRIDTTVRRRFFTGRISQSSEFFRDLFSSVYLDVLPADDRSVYDQMVAIYDRAITPVENQLIQFDFRDLVSRALGLVDDLADTTRTLILHDLEGIEAIDLTPADYIGTGYGRQLLPFKEEHIKSEILCHAMGAHYFFPKTRTVLDIGGQDTKAIQVDENGLVTSFQMNDRCAAGCGRYLGYIADEMNISVSELGPLAMEADYESNICSTCTVFAGAELREYLNLGEKKENILAGLHKAIVQRAFALLARSGGVRNEFTFTGGVARNVAVREYVSRLTEANYGKMTINCHWDSIFMGALGAAIFSKRRKA
ncbi:MAG: benzoyl-CoA reductase subunit A [Candidatus Neomarinimicrobiota bacterium]|nr:MAG: benzoyl-CoA reductase subunit A [Candidatus Neomarinimicrobiota bacterium]